MSIKAQVITDFLIAFKEKRFFEKDTLNLIKSKITEKEKATGSGILEDVAILDILQSMVKQRRDTISSYANIDTDKANAAKEAEQKQIDIISRYLPQQMNDESMIERVKAILVDFTGEDNKKLGAVMSYFKATYNGQYDSKKLSEIVRTLI